MRLQRACVLALSLLVALVHGQSPAAPPVGVADALRAQGHPLTAKELPEGLRAVALNLVGSDLFGGLGLFGFRGRSARNDPDSVKTALLSDLVGVILIDPDEFAAMLDGKIPRVRGYVLDLSSAYQAGPLSANPVDVPTPLFAETWVEGNRILQWTPRPKITKNAIVRTFTPTMSAPTASPRTRTLNKVRQVGLAVILYTQDHRNRMPRAASTDAAKALLLPYTHGVEVWKTDNPRGGRLVYNTALSGLTLPDPESFGSILVAWDSSPWPDGGRVVAYADGHAKYTTGQEWDGTVWPQELARRARRGALPTRRANHPPTKPSPGLTEKRRAVPAVQMPPRHPHAA